MWRSFIHHLGCGTKMLLEMHLTIAQKLEQVMGICASLSPMLFSFAQQTTTKLDERGGGSVGVELEKKWLQPFHEQSTTFCLINEVLSLWGLFRPGLATTWEHCVLQSPFSVCCCFCHAELFVSFCSCCVFVLCALFSLSWCVCIVSGQ